MFYFFTPEGWDIDFALKLFVKLYFYVLCTSMHECYNPLPLPKTVYRPKQANYLGPGVQY